MMYVNHHLALQSEDGESFLKRHLPFGFTQSAYISACSFVPTLGLSGREECISIVVDPEVLVRKAQFFPSKIVRCDSP